MILLATPSFRRSAGLRVCVIHIRSQMCLQSRMSCICAGKPWDQALYQQCAVRPDATVQRPIQYGHNAKSWRLMRPKRFHGCRVASARKHRDEQQLESDASLKVERELVRLAKVVSVVVLRYLLDWTTSASMYRSSSNLVSISMPVSVLLCCRWAYFTKASTSKSHEERFFCILNLDGGFITTYI